MLPIIKDRKLRIAVVGCGRISKMHFDAIKSHEDDFDLVAVCDSHDKTLEEVSRDKGVKGYNRLSKMIAEENIDIVSICTPSGLHPQQTLEIASAGCSVISEKPMATKWSDGKEMVNFCDRKGVRLFIVKQNRGNPTLQLLKRAIDEKRFGRIYLANFNIFWTRPQKYYDQARWRGTWELDGGAFMNQASHYVDLVDWLIGPVDSVQAMTGTLGRNVEVEDTGVLNIKWRNGAIGSMNVTMLTYPKNLEGSVTVLGEHGSVIIGGVAVNKIKHWEFKTEMAYDRSIDTANYETESVYGFGHSLYFKNVIDVFRGISEPETDGREGLKSLEVIIAAYLSARDGKSVSLPLEY